MTCTFFGHRDCPDAIYPKLYNTIEGLVLQNRSDEFLVGNQGRFDVLALKALRQLRIVYPHIRYAVVLAYFPVKDISKQPEETIFPDGIESVPPRFAISYRNRWMLDKADFVISYVAAQWGGAAQFADRAKREGKTVINIYR